MKRTAALVLLAVFAAAPNAGAAPKSGKFSGTLGFKAPKRAKVEVRAINREDGSVAGVKTASRTGAFSMSLPAGAYLIVGTAIPTRGKASAIKQARVSVSLKAGQKRTKAKLTARKKKKSKRKVARAAYVQELGQVTPGRVAVEIHAFTGATGELSVMNRGMADLLTTDVLQTAGDDCNVSLIEVMRRDDILKELELQKSPYFDQSTTVKRNFVLGDVEVRGTLKNGPGDKTLDYDVRLVDKAGKEVGRLKGSIDTTDIFKGEEKLAKELSDELCKLSDTYEVTLQLNGAANFATHSAGGTLNATIMAKRGGKKSPIWRGGGQLGFAGTSYASKLEGCSYIEPVELTGNWSATLTNLGNGDMLVEADWDTTQLATASVLCPDDPMPPPVPGQPGPSLITTEPLKFQLPVAGGVQPLSFGFTEGGDGWTNTGTMTVRPKGVARME
jgi:hypothetical protein